jgi:hypothetical protein
MQLRVLAAIAVTALSICPIASAPADEAKTYTEGTVTEVTSVRVKPGMLDKYMKWMDTTGKQLREDEKKAGIILDYAIYQVQPRSPQDPNLYLTITYKNMAALDDLTDRVEPLSKKIWATREESAKAAIERESLREILGTQLIRRLELK